MPQQSSQNLDHELLFTQALLLIPYLDETVLRMRCEKRVVQGPQEFARSADVIANTEVVLSQKIAGAAAAAAAAADDDDDDHTSVESDPQEPVHGCQPASRSLGEGESGRL